MKAFPKIFAIGTDYIKDIFSESVEITEKIDGSQFGFGKIDGELFIRSKGKQLFTEAPEKMFSIGVEYVKSIEDRLPEGILFYTEYLQRPKHNVLSYNRVPKNNLILFAVSDITEKFEANYGQLVSYSEILGIEVVPLLFHGKINNVNELKELLDIESSLGGPKVEGVVVKNYERKFLLGGQPMPLMSGKYVSEKFKEVMRTSWKGEHTNIGKWDSFKDSYRTEARWEKAIQHLQENGELENSPKDIGKLIFELQKDITEEEKEIIKEFLWKEFGKDILRKAVAGFPEWYKNKLMERSFE